MIEGKKRIELDDTEPVIPVPTNQNKEPTA